MKVTIKKSEKALTLKDIDVGELFRYGGVVYMKCYSSDFKTSTTGNVSALVVELIEGRVSSMANTNKIEHLEGELIIHA